MDDPHPKVDLAAINDWLKTFTAVMPKEPIIPPIKRNPRTGEVRDASGRLLMFAGPHAWRAIRKFARKQK